MGIVESLVKYSDYFPELNLQSKWLDSLKSIRSEANQGRYASLSVCLAIVLSISGFILLGQSTDFLGFAMLLGIFAVCLAVFIKLPDFEVSVKTARMESELPMALRTIALLLEMNVTFQRALGMASGEKGELNNELKAMVRESEKGASMQKTLSSFSDSTKSLLLKRAMNQLLIVYQAGTGALDLKKLADELLSIQRFRLREYASRAAILGLLFIAFSTILPTFFIVSTILGKGILESDVSENQVIFMFLVVFPVLSGMVVLIAKALLPGMVFGRKHGFNYMPVIAVSVLVASTTVLPQTANQILFAVIFLVLVFLFARDYAREKRIQETEDRLPDALMAAGAMPKGMKIDRMFEMWAGAGYGPLSEESSACVKQLRANIRPESVFSGFANRSNSQIIERVCGFIVTAINTNTTDRLNYVADDILKFREVDRERQNVLAMQKYTLLFASFLMPLITKSSIMLVSSMQELGTVNLDFSLFYGIMPVYILTYALLTAYFIAELEARRQSATLYFMVSAAISLSTFFSINI